MVDPISLWHAEHVNFARLLNLFEEQIDAFHMGRRPNYDLMVNILYYLRNFTDRFHHPREDVAFARLVERNPNLQLAVNRLLQEHRVIAAAGDELLRRLNDIVQGAMIEREAVEAAAATYLAYYWHHLAKEEREIIPYAAQLLTNQDWEAVMTAIPAGVDPLFGNNPEAETRFGDLQRMIEDQARNSPVDEEISDNGL